MKPLASIISINLVKECRPLDPSTAMTVKTLADTFGNTTAGLVDKLLGPAATNIGIQFGRLFEIRNERSEELLKAAQRKIEDLEIDVQRISARLYVALLNEASLEEDSDIQKIWADMLINAADKRQVNLVKDSFPSILSKLSSREIKFLQILYEHATRPKGPTKNPAFRYSATVERFGGDHLLMLYTEHRIYAIGSDATAMAPDKSLAIWREFRLSMDVIRLQNLFFERTEASIQNFETGYDNVPPEISTGVSFSISHLGEAFIAACQPPTKNERKG